MERMVIIVVVVEELGFRLFEGLMGGYGILVVEILVLILDTLKPLILVFVVLYEITRFQVTLFLQVLLMDQPLLHKL